MCLTSPGGVSVYSELDELMKRRREPHFVGLANQSLVSVLTRNLAHMEHFTRRDAVSLLCVSDASRPEVSCSRFVSPQLEKLALELEQQRGPGLRARAAFLVLVRTLLLSLGDLTGTQHLLTAQRVYMLLEPPLLDAIKDDSLNQAPVLDTMVWVSGPTAFWDIRE